MGRLALRSVVASLVRLLIMNPKVFRAALLLGLGAVIVLVMLA
jgi:hypothetical protein